MRSWQVITSVVILIVVLSFYLVVPEKGTFSVISQRNGYEKSSAITNKWDGKGSIVDMIWQ